jgi:hypothetical protein
MIEFFRDFLMDDENWHIIDNKDKQKDDEDDDEEFEDCD